MRTMQWKTSIIIIGKYLWKLLLFICGDTRGKLNRGVLWTFINTVATLAFLLFALLQIGQVSRITKGDVLQKFSANFFQQESRDFVLLFEYELLEFKSNNIGVDTISGLPHDFSCFVKASNYPPKLNKFLIDSTKTIYSAYEIDDYILGHFEDMGMSLKMGVIDVGEVYLNYGWYIIFFWENKEIKKYIDWCRAKYKDSASANYIYSNYLYNEMKKFQNEHPPKYYKEKGMY